MSLRDCKLFFFLSNFYRSIIFSCWLKSFLLWIHKYLCSLVTWSVLVLNPWIDQGILRVDLVQFTVGKLTAYLCEGEYIHSLMISKTEDMKTEESFSSILIFLNLIWWCYAIPLGSFGSTWGFLYTLGIRISWSGKTYRWWFWPYRCMLVLDLVSVCKPSLGRIPRFLWGRVRSKNPQNQGFCLAKILKDFREPKRDFPHFWQLGPMNPQGKVSQTWPWWFCSSMFGAADQGKT